MDDTPRRSRNRPRDLFVAPLDQARRGQPRFQFHDIQRLYAITTIDPDRVRPFLPRGLKLADTNTGVMSINTVGGGTWGAFTVALHGVAVEGMDSPDGMPAVYWLGGAADREGYYGYRSH